MLLSRYSRYMFLLVFLLSMQARAAHLSDPSFSEIRKTLKSLYPDLTNAQMDDRARNVTSPFKFLRSYVPYYYSLTSENRDALPNSILNMFTETGWCFGDAHPENFGAILQSTGKSIFTIDDLDDAGECPVVLDLLRFVVSSRMAYLGVDLGKLMDRYRKGLNGEAVSLSKFSQKLVEDSQGEGTKISKKLLNSDGLSLVRKEGFDSLSASQEHELKLLLQQMRGEKTQILDVMQTLHMEGGSGGLRRFVVLLNSQSDDIEYPQVIELKEIRRPGIFPAAVGDIPQDSNRYMATLALTQGKHAVSSYQVVTFLKKSFWMRPRWKGVKGVSLSDIPTDSVEAVIEDEAGVLGALHRKSVQNLKSYKDALHKVSVADWDSATQTITHWFELAYEALKK